MLARIQGKLRFFRILRTNCGGVATGLWPYPLSLPRTSLRPVHSVEIRWMVSDKNLTDKPLTLSAARKREGPWQPIARNVRNEGSYRWEFPRDAGGQFFVRLEACDQAGNVTRCKTPMPVVLDLTEPKAQVVGVTGVTGGAPPRGN